MQLTFSMVRNQKIREFKEILKEIQHALYGLKLTTPTIKLHSLGSRWLTFPIATSSLLICVLRTAFRILSTAFYWYNWKGHCHLLAKAGYQCLGLTLLLTVAPKSINQVLHSWNSIPLPSLIHADPLLLLTWFLWWTVFPGVPFLWVFYSYSTFRGFRPGHHKGACFKKSVDFHETMYRAVHTNFMEGGGSTVVKYINECETK